MWRIWDEAPHISSTSIQTLSLFFNRSPDHGSLPHRNPASAGIFRGSRAQGHDKRDALYMAGVNTFHTATASLYTKPREGRDGLLWWMSHTWWETGLGNLNYQTGSIVLLLPNSPPFKHQHKQTSTLSASFLRRWHPVVLKMGKQIRTGLFNKVQPLTIFRQFARLGVLCEVKNTNFLFEDCVLLLYRRWRNISD